jgi:hypothetical protein
MPSISARISDENKEILEEAAALLCEDKSGGVQPNGADPERYQRIRPPGSPA